MEKQRYTIRPETSLDKEEDLETYRNQQGVCIARYESAMLLEFSDGCLLKFLEKELEVVEVRS